jgi:MoxR-like ATPase
MTIPAHDTRLDTIAPVESVGADASDPERFERARVISDRLVANIETVVYGKRDEIKLVLTALMCGGHVLLEDVPGTAKTVLARAIAGSIEGAIPHRIQCTPDLQPTDVTGLAVFDQKMREFEFRPGPIFANVVAVDAINELRSAAQHVYVDPVLQRWVVELVRATRGHESVIIGSSVRGSLALERAARAWALVNGRSFVVPEDIEYLFVPVLAHRVVFTPSFVARARATGWPEAIEEFRSSCLELAPRPGSEDDPFFEHPHAV